MCGITQRFHSNFSYEISGIFPSLLHSLCTCNVFDKQVLSDQIFSQFFYSTIVSSSLLLFMAINNYKKYVDTLREFPGASRVQYMYTHHAMFIDELLDDALIFPDVVV